jgi:Putative methyltransferase
VDWHAWHESYDHPDSYLSRRLRVVQQRVRVALDDAPAGPIRVVSMCAGQGRDLLEVLPAHPRRDDVTARLVELEPRNVELARSLARDLPDIEVKAGDAALADSYEGMVPAGIVLMCGVFGNITDEDVERTVAASTQLCARGGTVIWTRHRNPPDLFPTVCGWFERHGYERVWESEPDAGFGVGVHRLIGPSRPLRSGERMFTFHGYKALT